MKQRHKPTMFRGKAHVLRYRLLRSSLLNGWFEHHVTQKNNFSEVTQNLKYEHAEKQLNRLLKLPHNCKLSLKKDYFLYFLSE